MKKIVVGCGLVFVSVLAAVVVSNRHTSTAVIITDKNLPSYIALGDSVAAGVGLANYSDSSACDRTDQSYPKLVAVKLHYKLTSLACSGATTTNGLNGSQAVNRLAVPAQLTEALKINKPKLITITIGANDAQWTSYIQKCYTATCGSAADTQAVEVALSVATDNLSNALNQIKLAFPTKPPTVLVTGYYKLFPVQPTAGNCTETTNIDEAEISWIKQLQDTIDSRLQTTAKQYDFVQFVSLSFSGHELCSADPWVQGLTAKAPFHPTAAGQAAIADQVIKNLKSGRK